MMVVVVCVVVVYKMLVSMFVVVLVDMVMSIVTGCGLRHIFVDFDVFSLLCTVGMASLTDEA